MITTNRTVIGHVQKDKCPTCGWEVKERRQYDLHTCGQWNKIVQFKCGYKVHYSPNFGKEYVERECINTPRTKLLVSKREDAMKRLISHIENMDVDDEFRESISKSIKYSTTSYYRLW